MKWRWSWLVVLLLACLARAAEVMPAAPEKYFNDYAGVTSAATGQQLNGELESFEKQTSNQIIAVIYPKMQSDSSVDDYCIRLFNSWKVGQKGKNNGAALFVFVQDRKMFIVTGYGLEGALPDATCKLIIDNEITPRFKAGDYGGGMKAGVEAMMAATKGEYKGNGQTANSRQRQGDTTPVWLIPIGIIILILAIRQALRRQTVYGSYGRRRGWYIGPWYGGGWGSGGGSWGGGGGGWGGGGGGFSGGGGSSGGGGAGGSW